MAAASRKSPLADKTSNAAQRIGIAPGVRKHSMPTRCFRSKDDKDAIRRTAGAYVLYPGSRNCQWRGFHEIVPGLGAFGIRPCEDGEDGTTALKEFIIKIVQHVCARSTRHEQETYHRFRIQDPISAPPLAVRAFFAECDVAVRLARPPRETPVLVGWYNSKRQLCWIAEYGRAAFHVISDEQSGGFQLTPESVGANYILLHTIDQQAAIGLYVVKSDEGGNLIPPELISAETLKQKHCYPPDDTIADSYLVYQVEPKGNFLSGHWDITKLLSLHGIDEKSFHPPFIATLDEVLRCAKQR